MAGTKSRVELMITSRVLTPAQIGFRVGLKGERRGAAHGAPVHEVENRWVLRSDVPEDEPLTTHVANLLGRLAPHVDEIRALADEHPITFTCVIYADSEREHNQEVFLSSEQVELISAMGAIIWADVYFLGGDD